MEIFPENKGDNGSAPKIDNLDKEILTVDRQLGALDERNEPLDIMSVLEDAMPSDKKRYLDAYYGKPTAFDVDAQKDWDEDKKLVTKLAIGKAIIDERPVSIPLADKDGNYIGQTVITPESIDTTERNAFKDGDDNFNYDIIDKDGNKKQVTVDEAKESISKGELVENLGKTAVKAGEKVATKTYKGAKDLALNAMKAGGEARMV